MTQAPVNFACLPRRINLENTRSSVSPLRRCFRAGPQHGRHPANYWYHRALSVVASQGPPNTRWSRTLGYPAGNPAESGPVGKLIKSFGLPMPPRTVPACASFLPPIKCVKFSKQDSTSPRKNWQTRAHCYERPTRSVRSEINNDPRSDIVQSFDLIIRAH